MRRFGIDLGTTNTCIYQANFSIGDTPEEFNLNAVNILYQNTGDTIHPPLSQYMPSAIYGRRKNDTSGQGYDFFIGTIAMRQARIDNVTEIINTKRLLCREDSKKVIQYGLTAQDIAQKLLEGCHYSLQEGYSVRQLKNAQFCITQPAAFGLFASQSIQKAAILAGFTKVEPQREPIAALLSFLYHQLKEQKSAERLLEKQKERGNKLLTLVVDIGGGTTDVTIQEINISGSEDPEQGSMFCTGYRVSFLNQVKNDQDVNIPVATANQEPAFGGFDFDKAVARHIVAVWSEQYAKQAGHDYNWHSTDGNTVIFNLYQRVQDYKNNLSQYPDEDLQEREETIVLDGYTLTCKVNAKLVYKWTEELCESKVGGLESGRTVYGIIADTIRRSGYKMEEIDYLFVTGGMSSFKPIREMLKKRFSEHEKRGSLIFSIRPLDDIAIGAAVCNCFFAVDMPQMVLYADLMMDDPCGEPRILVEKNKPLPAEGTITNFIQLRNPAYLYIDILWGLGTKDYSLKRLRRLRKPLPNRKITPIGTNVSVKWRIDVHQAMDIELIVHDPNKEYTIPLLKLIKNVDLSRGEDENA